MAGSKGNKFQENLINYVLGNNSFTPPETFYIALFSETFNKDLDPINSNLLLNTVELYASSYSRVSYVNDSSGWYGSNGTRSNARLIQFPEAEETWGVVRAWALMDVSTGGTGDNIFYWGNLTTPNVVDAGDILELDIGDLTITES